MKVVPLVLLIYFLFLSCYQNKDEEILLKISNHFYIYKTPNSNSLTDKNFPMDFILPNSKIQYFLHWERTGIWSPDQYVLTLEIDSKSQEEVWNIYKNLLKIKQWQILQTKMIKKNEQNVYFINAVDFFNRSITLLIEKKENTIVKIYLKKLTDE